MGCCDSSTQLGSHGGICDAGAGVVEGDAAGCEGIGLTSVLAECAEGTSAAKAVARCGETYVTAEATTHKADRVAAAAVIAAVRNVEGTPITGASGAEAPEVRMRFPAELKPRRFGIGAEGTRIGDDGAVENGGVAAGAGNSVGARNVLEIDNLRTMNSPTTGQGSAARWLLLVFVRFYQIFFSPFLGGACKFYPSCSRYAQEAIEVHGARRGAWLALKRLGRCRPFTKGGFDPVPEVVEEKEFEAGLDGAGIYRTRGTSAAKAAARNGETNVVAKATTHKPTTHKAASDNLSARKIMPAYPMLERRDADWLRTAREERAQ